MVKPGDTVRYLSEVGGGKVTRVEGRMAYVDDDGFERPVPVNELVVVLPAGLEQKGAKPLPVPQPTPLPEPEPVEETEYGDAMNVLLAFEPADARRLDSTTFNVALVNDSNYFLTFQLLTAAAERGEWTVFASGSVAPNEIADLKRLGREELAVTERIVFQALAYKRDKSFQAKEPINVSRKVDQTKFFKLHCFSPGLYFDSPVLSVPLLAEPAPRHGRKK